MAATEPLAHAAEGMVPIEHPLGTAYLDRLLALSRSANWNQTEDDWRTMLREGRGWGLSSPDGTVLASTVVLPYRGSGAPDFAWVSMVLVLPEHRRQGYASRLLQVALRWLEKCDPTPIVPMLDATPAGHPVYAAEGFRDTWGFARYARDVALPVARAPAPAGTTVVPLADAHWPGLLALDAPAFGGDRAALLRSLAARLPAAAHVALRGGRVCGYVLGRPGREAVQIGPLVSEDEATAEALLDAALAALPAPAAPVYADRPDAQAIFGAAMHARGFVLQRPFTRLVHPGRSATPPAAPGDATRIRLVAGPELG